MLHALRNLRRLIFIGVSTNTKYFFVRPKLKKGKKIKIFNKGKVNEKIIGQHYIFISSTSDPSWTYRNSWPVNIGWFEPLAAGKLHHNTGLLKRIRFVWVTKEIQSASSYNREHFFTRTPLPFCSNPAKHTTHHGITCTASVKQTAAQYSSNPSAKLTFLCWRRDFDNVVGEWHVLSKTVSNVVEGAVSIDVWVSSHSVHGEVFAQVYLQSHPKKIIAITEPVFIFLLTGSRSTVPTQTFLTVSRVSGSTLVIKLVSVQA